MIMSNSEVKAIVFNTPEDVDKYIVAKAVCGELWYWGSWDNKNDAFRVAKQFDKSGFDQLIQLCNLLFAS